MAFARRTALVLCAMLPAATGGCKMPKPTVKVREVSINPSADGRVNVQIGLDVYNPYYLPIWLKDSEASVRTAGGPLAEGKVRKPIARFGPRSNRRVHIEAGVTVKQLKAVLAQLGRGKAVPYRMKGRIVFSLVGIGVPVEFSKKQRLRPPRMPKWFRMWAWDAGQKQPPATTRPAR